MYQPEYLVIALSTLGLLLRTRAAYFRRAYQKTSANENALRNANRELRALRASEAQARCDAEEAARVKSQFLAHVSHEVRTPLNAISGTAQMLQQTALTPEQQAYVDVLSTGSETLQAILGDILDYARIEAGKLELEPQPVQLAPAIDGAMKLLQTAASAKGLQLVHRIGPGVPATILADPLRLRQVLLNLLSNAVKFTRSGSITVTVSRVAGADDDDDLLQFAVRDTGCGIPPEQQEALFQPFIQGPRAVHHNGNGANSKGVAGLDAAGQPGTGNMLHSGAGLGLAISKELVALMGGDIWLQSRPQHGSTFTFTLPLQPAS